MKKIHLIKLTIIMKLIIVVILLLTSSAMAGSQYTGDYSLDKGYSGSLNVKAGADNKIVFTIDSVSESAHICSIDGEAVLKDNSLIYKDSEVQGCTVKIVFSDKDKAGVNVSSECNSYYCGARVLFVNGTYTKIKLNEAKDLAKSEIVITDTAIGPINNKTPFDLETITSLLPGYNVYKGEGFIEGDSYPIINVSDGGSKPIMIINPSYDHKAIHSIEIYGKSVKSKFSGKIGDSFKTVYGPESNPQSCVPMVEGFSGKISCKGPLAKHVYYIFNGHWDGPDGLIPPQKALDSYVLEFIMWNYIE